MHRHNACIALAALARSDLLDITCTEFISAPPKRIVDSVRFIYKDVMLPSGAETTSIGI